jgi:hypothetical protein
MLCVDYILTSFTGLVNVLSTRVLRGFKDLLKTETARLSAPPERAETLLFKLNRESHAEFHLRGVSMRCNRAAFNVSAHWIPNDNSVPFKILFDIEDSRIQNR